MVLKARNTHRLPSYPNEPLYTISNTVLNELAKNASLLYVVTWSWKTVKLLRTLIVNKAEQNRLRLYC